MKKLEELTLPGFAHDGHLLDNQESEHWQFFSKEANKQALVDRKQQSFVVLYRYFLALIITSTVTSCWNVVLSDTKISTGLTSRRNYM